jgi:hypothetical protein
MSFESFESSFIESSRQTSQRLHLPYTAFRIAVERCDSDLGFGQSKRCGNEATAFPPRPLVIDGGDDLQRNVVGSCSPMDRSIRPYSEGGSCDVHQNGTRISRPDPETRDDHRENR